MVPHAEHWSGKKDPWEGIQIDLIALRSIVCEVMRVPSASCSEPVSLRDEEEASSGNFSRIYSFKLPASTVVAKLITPIKPLFRTESEVAAMDFARAHTTLPIPKVYSYCSEASNPVGAEWILMDFVSGRDMDSIWYDHELSLEQKQKLGRDVVEIHGQLSKLKANACGGIYHGVGSVDDFNLSRTPRWRPLSVESLRMLRELCTHALNGGYVLGPLQTVPLGNYRYIVPSPARTMPVFTSEDYVNLMASRGLPSTWAQIDEIMTRRACVDLFGALRKLYPNSRVLGPDADSTGFSFAHGDLHGGNIFVDPSTGAITGIIDWECAAFCPMWTEVAGIGWFCEDRDRMYFGCDYPRNFEGETEEDARLRAWFRRELYRRDSDLFTSFLGGSELRAVCDAAGDWPRPDGSTYMFLSIYDDEGSWNVARRGPFPFDMYALFYKLAIMDSERQKHAAQSEVHVPESPAGCS